MNLQLSVIIIVVIMSGSCVNLESVELRERGRRKVREVLKVLWRVSLSVKSILAKVSEENSANKNLMINFCN